MKKMLAICLTVAMLLTALPVAAFMFGSTQALAADSGSGQVQKGWVQVPMDEDGNNGGEAGQMVLGLTFDSIDGKLGFFGTDVAGIYRTKDGGKTWAPANNGYQNYGATGFAIDPMNKDRVLCTGAKGGPRNQYVHLSTNGGDSWSPVLTVGTTGFRDQRVQFAFDVSSYDEDLGYCTTVYYSRENNFNDRNSSGKYNAPQIYKSIDGGENWTALDDTSHIAGGYIAVGPDGTVYAISRELVGETDTNNDGFWDIPSDYFNDNRLGNTGYTTKFYKSTDGGENWTVKSVGGATTLNSMDCVTNYGEYTIYVTTDSGFFVSYNGGENWTKVNTDDSYPSKYATALKVNPKNTSQMVLQQCSGTVSNSTRINYYSSDGGATWNASSKATSRKDNDSDASYAEGHFMPTGNQVACFAWSNGSVFVNWKHIVKSTNGGKNYDTWSNAGYAAIYASGYARFNVNNSNLISISSQDYSGALSTNGGKTWKYMDWTGQSWGAYTYGSYALSEDVAFAGVANEWLNEGGKTYLAVTKDGCDTVTIYDNGALNKTQNNSSYIHNSEVKEITGDKIGMGALGKDTVGFLGEWRTADSGNNWTEMENCRGVFALDTDTGRLFGRNDSQGLVYSDDDGANWTVFASYTEGKGQDNDEGKDDGKYFDMAYDSINDKLYVVNGDSLTVYNVPDGEISNTVTGETVIGKTTAEAKFLNRTDTDRTVYLNIQKNPCTYVAVDAQNGNIYVSNGERVDSCWVSSDGGANWTALTTYANPDTNAANSGARQVTSMTVRYNDVTQSNELFCFTSCYGVWKYVDIPEQIPEKDTIDENAILPTPETETTLSEVIGINSNKPYDATDWTKGASISAEYKTKDWTGSDGSVIAPYEVETGTSVQGHNIASLTNRTSHDFSNGFNISYSATKVRHNNYNNSNFNNGNGAKRFRANVAYQGVAVGSSISVYLLGYGASGKTVFNDATYHLDANGNINADYGYKLVIEVNGTKYADDEFIIGGTENANLSTEATDTTACLGTACQNYFTDRTIAYNVVYDKTAGTIIATANDGLKEYSVTANVNATDLDLDSKQFALKTNVNGYQNYVAYSNLSVKTYSEAVTPEITGASISVGESLSLNAYIDATDAAIAEKYTAKFTRYGKDGTTTIADNVSIEAVNINGETKYRATFDAIAPQCMGDTIVIELVNEDEKTVKVEWTTVRNNLLGVMEKAKTPELYSLCKETLAYGAAAQKYKEYKTDALVDRGLVNLSEFEESDSDVDFSPKDKTDFKWKSASMFFNNANSFKIKFTSTDDNATGYTVTCKADDGTQINCKPIKAVDGVYLIETDLISAVDLSKVYTFTVKNGNVEVGTLKYSVKSYAIAMANKDNANMTALAQRLYLYGVSAAKYANS